MIGLLNESDWKIQKREPYQKYKDYEYVIMNRTGFVGDQLS